MELNIKFLETLREAHGENVRQFAKRIGVSHQTYYNYTRGKSEPTISIIGKIGEKLRLKDAKALII